MFNKLILLFVLCVTGAAAKSSKDIALDLILLKKELHEKLSVPVEKHGKFPNLKKQIIELEASIETLFEKVSTIVATEKELKKEVRVQKKEITKFRGAHYNTSAIIQRISRHSPLRLFIENDNIRDYIHKSILLRHFLRSFQSTTQTLSNELSALSAKQKKLDLKALSYQKEAEVLEQEVKELETNLIEMLKDLKAQERKKTESKKIKNFIGALGGIKNGKSYTSTELKRITPYVLPLDGNVFIKYGDQKSIISGEKSPLKSKGILIKSLERSVKAPFNGYVVFAGPFLKYGQLLIIAHQAGYHALLAGMKTIAKKVGDRVKANETVATMEAVSSKIGKLYMEIRYKGSTIDPLALFPDKESF